MVFLGQRTIEKYGCYSCHDIKGFENAKPIGADLTIEGSKSTHLFDFGFVHEYEAHDGKEEHVLHTAPSWIHTKVRSPRVWDDKREKVYQDKLKMPNFYVTPKEAETITSVIVGLTEDRVDPHKLASRDSRQRVIEEGRKLVSQHNCRGCHVVTDYGRAIADTIEDPGLLPPDLTPEGSRVQSEWLFNFLKDPSVMNMRPWLGVRMPTFHFPDVEADTLVKYFAAEGRTPHFDTTRQFSPPARNVAIGRAVFEMLKCAQCHPTGPVSAAAVADAASLAPNLQLSRVRLRHEWIPDWILRPNEIIPGTKMPTNFPRDVETGAFSSPLSLAIASPQFAQYKTALMQYYRTDEELTRAAADAPVIASYLRDYIWSIGSGQMRERAPADERLIPPPLQIPGAPAIRQTEVAAPQEKSPSR
jgi:cytochrome c2